MKTRYLFSLSAFLLCSVGGVIFAGTFLMVPRPLGTDPSRYVENPAPIYLNNVTTPESRFISARQVKEALVASEGSRIAEPTLITWGDYSRQEGKSFPQVADGRMVWVLDAYYPRFDDYRLGSTENAQVTLVFDAETGNLLHREITGKPIAASE